MNKLIWILFILYLSSCNVSEKSTREEEGSEVNSTVSDTLRYEEETHLKNIRQLTFGGDNAEAYFSFDDQHLVLQRAYDAENIPCDQIYYGKIPVSPDEDFEMNLVSTGKGRTTCSYFMPGDSLIIYASTHTAGEDCPPEPDRSMGYVWPIYNSYELFIADLNGNIRQQLTDNEFYDAEATVSPQGDKIVFTSTRNGDLDLYTMDIDGTNIQQITDVPGYDGGAFFSPDGSKLIFRASRPEGEELEDYRNLLKEGLIRPGALELFVCDADGSNLKRITDLGQANWAPFFHPSGEKIIFASNHKSGGRTFNLFMVNLDGTELEQITYDEQFDAFPMFSYDGTKLVFASNRNNGGTRETNIFIADWIE